jgi:alkylation response protein AidB-like acyl-CoA dehydrogenase
MCLAKQGRGQGGLERAAMRGEAEHHAQLRETLRRFVEREAPRSAAAAWDREERYPRDLFLKLAGLGLMGLTVPEAYGGAGRDITATMIVIEELSRRSLALSIPYIMCACYAGMNLLECGSDSQKAEFLPKVAAGELMFAYGWTEPDVGADVASVTTTAKRSSDGLVVNGAKRFCSGPEIADYIYALVRTGEPEARHRNLSFVLVPPSAPGVSIRRIETLGQRGAPATDVVFDNVEVPLSNLIGGEAGWNQGWSMLTSAGLDVEKLEVAAIGVGVAQAAVEDAWAYAQQRRQFGKPIAEYQSVQHKLAGMAVRTESARRLLYHAAALADAGEACGLESSMAKLEGAEAAKAVALDALTVFGAYGYTRDFDVERYVRDALGIPIIGGSSAIQLNNIFKAIGRQGGFG